MNCLRTIFVLVSIVTLLAINICASSFADASARLDRQDLRWRGKVIKIDVSKSVLEPNFNIKSGSDVIGAVNRSILAWQDVADVRIVWEASNEQNVSPAGDVGDGVSLITIAQTPDNVLLFSKNAESEAARTRIFYNSKDNITEGDIVLNPFQQFSTDGTFGTFDLESTLTHEIGHLLGLRHSSVWGSTMAESRAKNGTFGIVDFSSRILSASDISSIRALYGMRDMDDRSCCATISGGLSEAAGFKESSLKDTRVWAEDRETGRVVGQAELNGDGTFRLGGLPPSSYLVFWRTVESDGRSSIGEIGLFKVDKGDTEIPVEKISPGRSKLALDYIGINGRLADAAISVDPGLEYTIYLGGQGLDPKKIGIEFNSPFFRVDPSSLVSQDFGKNVSVVSFTVTVEPNTPSGSYSVYAVGNDDSRSSLIGAVSVGTSSAK